MTWNLSFYRHLSHGDIFWEHLAWACTAASEARILGNQFHKFLCIARGFLSRLCLLFGSRTSKDRSSPTQKDSHSALRFSYGGVKFFTSDFRPLREMLIVIGRCGAYDKSMPGKSVNVVCSHSWGVRSAGSIAVLDVLEPAIVPSLDRHVAPHKLHFFRKQGGCLQNWLGLCFRDETKRSSQHRNSGYISDRSNLDSHDKKQQRNILSDYTTRLFFLRTQYHISS